MNLADEPTPSNFLERAIDARSDAAHAALLDEIRESRPDEQFEAAALLADVEGFRHCLLEGEANPALTATLLNISRQVPRQAFDWREVANRPVNWRHIAACLAVAMSMLAYALWPTSSPRAVVLDARLAGHIGDLATQTHDTLVWPAERGDPLEKLTTWQECHLPFTPDILQPAESVRFVDGGAVSFDGTPALFTQWTTDHARYVLYQFDRKALGLPASFTQEALPLKNQNTRINIWPGNDGTSGWALMSIDAPGGNPFTDVTLMDIYDTPGG